MAREKGNMWWFLPLDPDSDEPCSDDLSEFDLPK